MATQSKSERDQKTGEVVANVRAKAINFDPKRILLIVTNIDTVETLAYGGKKVTFANGYPLTPGEPGSSHIFEGIEAQAALYLVGDTDKTPAYLLSWIRETK